MSFSISGTNITLTRGDTFRVPVVALLPDSETDPYIPVEGDSVRFALKSDFEDEEPLLVVDIPIDTMILTIKPEDTKKLPFGKYMYDVQMTFINGDTDTFIPKGRLRLTEEVD